MTDIVERLHNPGTTPGCPDCGAVALHAPTVTRDMAEAADEIERLRKALEEAAAHLAGAASAYRKHASRSATLKPRAVVDTFFSTRAKDFDKAAERAVSALRSHRGTR